MGDESSSELQQAGLTVWGGASGETPHLCWSGSPSEHGRPVSSPRATSAGQQRAGTFVTQGNRMSQGTVAPPSWPKQWHREWVFVPKCGTQAGHQLLGLAGWHPGAGVREDGKCTGRRAEHEVPDGVGRWASSGWVEFLSLKMREEPGLALLESDVLRCPQSWAR